LNDGPTLPGCASCLHFRSGAAAFEAAVPGMTSMASGFADSRGGNGLCLHHDLMLRPTASCGTYEAQARA